MQQRPGVASGAGAREWHDGQTASGARHHAECGHWHVPPVCFWGLRLVSSRFWAHIELHYSLRRPDIHANKG